MQVSRRAFVGGALVLAAILAHSLASLRGRAAPATVAAMALVTAAVVGLGLPTGVQVGHGVRFAATSRVFYQGDRVNTSGSLDLAVDGDGFFAVQKPGGETVYTRDGSFKLDANGQVVTAAGYPLIPAINIPIDATEITILPDGTVSVQQPGQTTPTNLGQIELSRFQNPAGLRAEGGNLYAPSASSGDPETGIAGEDGFGQISQGFLEGSNVNVAEELVRMILAQRAFEVNSRVIQAGDDMLRLASSLSS